METFTKNDDFTYYKFLLDFKKAEMGLVNSNDDFTKLKNIKNEILVKTFNKPGEPNEIELVVPPTFFLNKLENIAYKFSKVFSLDSEFEVVDFDYSTRILTIKRKKDIPKNAKWDYKYINKYSNFIPLGIGANNEVVGYSPSLSEKEKIGAITPNILISFTPDSSSSSIINSIMKTASFKSRDVYIVSAKNPTVSKFTYYTSEKKSKDDEVPEVPNDIYSLLLQKSYIQDIRESRELNYKTLKNIEDILDKRFRLCEQLGINNIADLEFYNTDVKKDIFVIIPEIEDILSHIKTKNEDLLFWKNENERIIEKITRLGRAMGIFTVITSKSLSVDILPKEIKQNLTTRVSVGPVPRSVSQMLFGSNIGETIHENGRGLIKTHLNDVIPFQVFDHE